MVKIKRGSPLASFNVIHNAKAMFMHHEHGTGLAALGGALLLLSLLAGWQGLGLSKTHVAGEIAEQDVVAPADMAVEDTEATRYFQEQLLAEEGASIYDLESSVFSLIKTDLEATLAQIRNHDSFSPEINGVAAAFNDRNGSRIPDAYFRILAQNDVNSFVLDKALPWLASSYALGVLPSAADDTASAGFILVREMQDSGTERLTRAHDAPDMEALFLELEDWIQRMPELAPQAGMAIMDIMRVLLRPNLTLNQEATDRRNAGLLAVIEPVVYHVKQGEVVVRAGDRVGHQQQILIQAIRNRAESLFNWHQVMGCLTIGIILTLGLFMTPSGNKGTVLHTRDQWFIALLLLFFGIAAWSFGQFVLPPAESGITTAMAFAFPVAGGAGLAALIFSARRYCTVGLLLSFFCTMLLQGGFFLFLFFFLSSMFNTWLVLRAQNRQDVVWSGLPLFVWLVVIGIGAGIGSNLGLAQMPALLVALSINAVFSISVLFVLSPIMEMAMGFTTRFRLMELMNLEQPLLQSLMMTSPGTYHHSLLVSYLVEAGARAVGANSLLCKVGALYHDIGKLSKPDYFVENQFGGPNPHDSLSPSMSSLILGSHVKLGSELADEYKLGREIKDIIIQHHGTRCISFFYQKAKVMDGNARLEDYSYVGPKPQSSEAAIVMIADAVEASSRTLVDPTPARIQAHVEGIIKGIYAEGQLDESELTFKDLSKLTDSFVRILTGLFHKRIDYPERNEKAARAGEEKEVFPPLPAASSARKVCGTTRTKHAPHPSQGAAEVPAYVPISSRRRKMA